MLAGIDDLVLVAIHDAPPENSDSLRDVARQGEDKAHRLVTGISSGVEHARTTAVDHRDAALPAIRGRGLGDAAGAGAAVHPDVLDPEFGALEHRLVGDLGPRADHDSVDAARDRVEIVV